MTNRIFTRLLVGTLSFLLCLPFSIADEIRKVDFATYSSTAKELNSTCASKGMAAHAGFCLSQAYGKATVTSITVGLEIASFEYFYRNCEHSEFSSANEVLAKAKRVLDAAKYVEEMRGQDEALGNYVGHFYFCKTKNENDSVVSNRLKWFEYMTGKYSGDLGSKNGSGSNVVSGSNSSEYTASVGNERLSLICNGSGTLDTACLIRLGSSGSAQPVRFIAQPTRYVHLLRIGVEKALAPERRPSASNIGVLREISLDQCHPAADSNGMSGDILQLCIPSDSSKVVLFMRGLCDRCDFDPVVLEKQVPQ